MILLTRIFFFLLGFGFTVIGFTYIILYMNLFTLGYTTFEYIQIVFTKPECLFAFIGLIFITITIFKKGGKHYDIHI